LSIIVEDGTGLNNSNSYASVAEADAYFSLRGVATWKNPDTAKEIRTLTLSAGADADGDIVITLDDVEFTVPVTIGNTTQVCGEIRAFAFTGWATSGNDGVVIFTADKAELRDGTYSLDGGTTGVVDSFVQTQAGSDAVKEQALVRATASIDGLYNSAWPGLRLLSTQSLAWPRTQAWDLDGFPLTGVPASVKVATIEGALLEALNPGVLSPSYDRGGAIIKEKVGPIETTYSEAASPMTTYNTIRQALSRIIRAGGGVVFRRG
jgi:hypothetical protein